VARYHVFCHFGKALEEKIGKPGSRRVNSRKTYLLIHRIRTFLPEPIYLYPTDFIHVHEGKTAKVAQYPVTDNT
jgi:hypothetical protein